MAIEAPTEKMNSTLKRTFTPNRHFRRDYNRLFRKDPAAANLFLLLAELADERGQVKTDEAELARLMSSRFEDPKAYQLSGRPRR